MPLTKTKRKNPSGYPDGNFSLNRADHLELLIVEIRRLLAESREKLFQTGLLFEALYFGDGQKQEAARLEAATSRPQTREAEQVGISSTPPAPIQREKKKRTYRTNQPPSGTQRLITIQQVVIEFGFPIGTIRDLVFRGALPRVAIPDGRRWWFDRRDVEKFIENSKK